MEDSEDLFIDSELLPQSSLKSQGEEEELSAGEVITRLKSAWSNEKFSPELLPPQTEIVNCILDQISDIKSSLSNKPKDFESSFHKMEIQRLKFLVSSYLRYRLIKIQTFYEFLSPEDSCLSKEESIFLIKYQNNLHKSAKDSILSHLPGDFSKPPKIDSPVPDSSSWVFIKVLENVTGIVLEDDAGLERDEELDLVKGSQHLLKYKAIRHLIQRGSVQLI